MAALDNDREGLKRSCDSKKDEILYGRKLGHA